MAWKKVSEHLPTLWICPQANDKTACANAIGRSIEFTIQNRENRKNDGGKVFPWYTLLVGAAGPGKDGSLPIVTVATTGSDGKPVYEEVPFKAGELYQVKAPGNLDWRLARYWGTPGTVGLPMRVVYDGLSDPYDKEVEPGKTEKVRAQRFSLEVDDAFVPLEGPQATALLEGPAAGDGG